MFSIQDDQQKVKTLSREEIQALVSELLGQSTTQEEKPVQIDMQALQRRFLQRMAGVKSEGTLRAYRYDLQAFQLPDACPSVDEIAFRVKVWKDSGISPNTIKRRMFSLIKFLKAFPIQFSSCVAEIQDFASNCHRVPAKQRKAATRKDVEKALKEVCPRTGFAIALMYYAGLRVGDVASLRVGDIKKRDGKFCVEIRTHKRGTYVSIPFVPQLERAYRRYMQVRNKRELKKDEALILSQRGSVLSVRQIQRDVSACFAWIGVEDISCHSLRHGCATALAQTGAPVYVIAKILGHSMRGVTSRYIHLTNKDLYNSLAKAFHLKGEAAFSLLAKAKSSCAAIFDEQRCSARRV